MTTFLTIILSYKTLFSQKNFMFITLSTFGDFPLLAPPPRLFQPPRLLERWEYLVGPKFWQIWQKLKKRWICIVFFICNPVYFSAKYLYNFVSPSLKLHNRYCNTQTAWLAGTCAGQTTMTKHVFFSFNELTFILDLIFLRLTLYFLLDRRADPSCHNFGIQPLHHSW